MAASLLSIANITAYLVKASVKQSTNFFTWELVLRGPNKSMCTCWLSEVHWGRGVNKFWVGCTSLRRAWHRWHACMCQATSPCLARSKIVTSAPLFSWHPRGPPAPCGPPAAPRAFRGWGFWPGLLKQLKMCGRERFAAKIDTIKLCLPRSRMAQIF